MHKFYVTYAEGSNLKGCYSVIEAPDMKVARAIAFEVTHGSFAFIYDETRWIVQDTGGKTQAEQWQLHEVELQAQWMIGAPVCGD